MSQKLAKKMRRSMRQESEKIYKQFSDNFDANDYVKPCPKFVPRIVWNILIWLVIKK